MRWVKRLGVLTAGAALACGVVMAQPAPSPPAGNAQSVPPLRPQPEVPLEIPPQPTLPLVEPPPLAIPDLAPAAKLPAAKKEPPKPVPPPPPMKRVRAPAAVLQAIDKVTARSIRFVAPVGKPVRYQNLIFTVRACEMSAPDEPREGAFAYLVIDSQPRQPGRQGRQVFRGWMFSNSPGVNPLEHPVYDAWLVSCSAAPPAVPADKR
jgi:hypothetical protein